jgi:hypothetical protein
LVAAVIAAGEDDGDDDMMDETALAADVRSE